jgi:cytoskeletal protein CcmA (bactofilin family)
MGIFGRDDQTETGKTTTTEPRHRPKPVTSSGAPSTVIATSAHVDGELKGSGDIRIEGNLTGRIDSTSSVLVAEAGHVKAEVKAETVIVAGRIEGNITAEQKIELTPTADMRGDLNAPRITISEGATFEGQVVMTGTKGGAKPAPAKKNDRTTKDATSDTNAADAKNDNDPDADKK